MNNHLQLCRILLLQIHGKLKPISISSTLWRSFSRSCSGGVLAEVVAISLLCWKLRGWLSPYGELWAMPVRGLVSPSLPPKRALGQVRGRLDVMVLSSAGQRGLGGAAVKVGAGLGAWGSISGSAGGSRGS